LKESDHLKPRTTPLVTVVMPNLNKVDYIEAAIRSVLGQTIQNLELVIVDDASTDGSAEIAKRYAERDPRVTLVRHPTTLGVSAARNTGLRNSRSGIIGFIDSDDTYAPTKLEKQLNLLERSKDPTVIYCDYWRIDGQGKELPPSRWPVYKESGMIFGDVLQDKFGAKTTILLKRECFKEVGLFDETLPFAEDLDMILRLSWVYPFSCLDEKLYSYRIFEGNTRRRLPESSLNLFRGQVIEKHYKHARSTLTPEQRKAVLLRLTVHFSRASRTRKMIRYGLGSYGSFRYLLSYPFRGRGLRKVLPS
jgi:glycosyltransferase involved in cell wall biosynthesis